MNLRGKSIETVNGNPKSSSRVGGGMPTTAARQLARPRYCRDRVIELLGGSDVSQAHRLMVCWDESQSDHAPIDRTRCTISTRPIRR